MPATHPDYRTTATEAGADVNYDCPCGCDAGFAYRRAEGAQTPESCCCGREMLVGRDAEARLRQHVEAPETYAFDRQMVDLPWGESIEVALATPPSANEGHEECAHDAHEAHDHDAHDHEAHDHGGGAHTHDHAQGH